MSVASFNDGSGPRPDSGAYSSAMAEDGDTALPHCISEQGDEQAGKALQSAHDHADPDNADRETDDVDHLSSKGERAGAADEQATQFKRSI